MDFLKIILKFLSDFPSHFSPGELAFLMELIAAQLKLGTIGEYPLLMNPIISPSSQCMHHTPELKKYPKKQFSAYISLKTDCYEKILLTKIEEQKILYKNDIYRFFFVNPIPNEIIDFKHRARMQLRSNPQCTRTCTLESSF